MMVKKEVLYASFCPPIIPRVAMSQMLGTSDLQYMVTVSLILTQGEEHRGVLSLPPSPCTLHGVSELKVCVYSKSDLFYHWYLAVI